MLQEYLDRLTGELKLGPIQPNEKKVFRLSLSAERGVDLQLVDGKVVLFTAVVACPTVRQELLFSLLMQANLFGQGTGGAAIGLDAGEKFITLSQAIPDETDYKHFREVLEDFVNYADYWKEEVIKFVKEEAAQT